MCLHIPPRGSAPQAISARVSRLDLHSVASTFIFKFLVSILTSLKLKIGVVCMEAEGRHAEQAAGLEVPLAAYREVSEPLLEVLDGLAVRLTEHAGVVRGVESGGAGPDRRGRGNDPAGGQASRALVSDPPGWAHSRP